MQGEYDVDQVPFSGLAVMILAPNFNTIPVLVSWDGNLNPTPCSVRSSREQGSIPH